MYRGFKTDRLGSTFYNYVLWGKQFNVTDPQLSHVFAWIDLELWSFYKMMLLKPKYHGEPRPW